MKKLILYITAILSSSFSFAQSGWMVNPADYQYSMTITGEALIDCLNNIETIDEVAAFEGSTCRGAIQFGTEFNGSNLAYLIVYSNQSQGENITFKIYDASQDLVIELLTSLVFEENSSYGMLTIHMFLVTTTLLLP